MIRQQLSSKAAAQVPDALVRAAILYTLGEVTLTFDGLCRTLECNSTAGHTMILGMLTTLVLENKVSSVPLNGRDPWYRATK